VRRFDENNRFLRARLSWRHCNKWGGAQGGAP
jgi:hypothetical protein